MADHTAIEWAHATVNAISGCTPISPGCTNCYAMRAGGFRRPNHPSNGLTMPSNAGHVWTGAVRLNEAALRRPLAWQKPRRIFWNAHGDPWHDAVPVEWIDRELAVAAIAARHRHLFLTKRSTHMRRYFEDPSTPERILDEIRALTGALPARWQWPLPNVWLGVSVEDQTRADERIPDLLDTPAAVRWLSCEPLLGPIDLNFIKAGLYAGAGALAGQTIQKIVSARHRIDWVVVGGESGPGARPMSPQWVYQLRAQCAEHAIPFLFKQWGEWLPCDCDYDGDRVVCYPLDGSERDMLEIKGPREIRHISKDLSQPMWRVGKRAAGRLLDGRLHDAYPELLPWEKAQEMADA